MIIKVDKGKENYSQRNNALRPLESCNVTSMCMALDYMGYTFPQGSYAQPEDNFLRFIETDKTFSEFASAWRKKNAWAGGIRPAEIHELLNRAANMWLRKEKVLLHISA